MSKKLAFGWVLHQHQPIGNFPWVFAQVYDVCYAPLLDAFERHPQVRVTMHYSGPLLDWLVAEHPDYIQRLAALAQRGQIEIMTGGYYEPILPILPEYDAHHQITKMNGAIQEHFGVGHGGLWLAERVWEPNLPSILKRASVPYTVLDDTHFLMAGLTPDELYGYYMTEDQGQPVAVFPNPQVMRAIIPWRSVDEVTQQFRELHAAANGQQRIVVLADDGEKFGSWPGTYEPLWTGGYVEAFLTMLEQNSDWLETVQLGEYQRREAPLGRVYLPTASYAEMMEWALPTERSAQLENLRHALEHRNETQTLSFLRGGSWRNFAAKYPEANTFHKKMLRVHGKVRAAAPLLGPGAQAAWDQLWQGQCNCGYWHGVFGGLYLADIRSAIFQHLIRAEALVDAALPSGELAVEMTDFDCDGRDEILIEGAAMDVYLAPHDGGSIFEWDYKAVPFNVVDTLARREEPYHRKLTRGHVEIQGQPHQQAEGEGGAQVESDETISIHDLVRAKEAGLEQLLHYDRGRRATLREHFLPRETTLHAFAASEDHDQGDFAFAPYEAQIEDMGGEKVVVNLWRDGQVRDAEGDIPVRLRKILTINANTAAVQVHYTLQNLGTRRVTSLFGVESNWGLLGGGGNPMAWYTINGDQPTDHHALNATGAQDDVREVTLTNAGVGVAVRLTAATPAHLWRFPVETVSNSEGGFERVYQCSCTLLHWPVDIAPGDCWQVELHLEVDRG